MPETPLPQKTIEAADYQAPNTNKNRDGLKKRSGFKKSNWILIALALLCVLFILFTSFAKSIRLNPVTANLLNPNELEAVDAKVSIDGIIKLPLGSRWLVLQGKHQVKATAKGFVDLSQSIDVKRESNQQFELVMQPLPGKLDINLTPAVKAKLKLDGKALAELPGIVENIPAGRHQLEIDAPLYRPHSQSILVQGREQTESLEVSLQPAWAEVSIDSQPSNAQIKVDNEIIGKTPLTAKIEEGRHEIAIELPKFKTHRQSLNVVAQQNQGLPAVKLAPADGVLEVDTKPKGAAIIVDGEYQGVSPITLQLQANKTHKLQVYKAGYARQSKQYQLSPEQKQSDAFVLSAELVPLKISVSPKDAVVYVDGLNKGKGSQTLTLSSLAHTIEVKKSGYQTFKTSVIPSKGQRQIVIAKLLTNQQAFWANIKSQYTAKAGQSMLLFKAPLKVSMGSSRREAGRRANEVQYSARLTKHFYVSQHEVTNKQYRLFDPKHSSGNYKQKSLDSAKKPVVNISWQKAALYCNWLSKQEGLTPFYKTQAGFVSGNNQSANGYRLLTEAEWAWLARNTSKGVKVYPWGNSQQPPSKPMGNFADVSASKLIAFTLPNYNDTYATSSPVGKFAKNHRGLYDIDGNVSEWVNDWYDANFNQGDNAKDPLGPEIGEFHVVRGASWAKGHLPQLRLAYRDYNAKGRHDIGFRIARYVGKAN